MWIFWIALVSDSEARFLHFEKRFLIIYFCLLMIFSLSVCLFDLVYPIFFLCGVITRSYHSSLFIQLRIIIVCLFPKLSVDISFRMMDAILGLVISNVLNLQFFVVSLTWGVNCRVGEKSIYRFVRMIVNFS